MEDQNTMCSPKTTIFYYIRTIKCNKKIINVSKYPAKGSGLITTKTPKINIIIPLWPSYYLTHTPQKTISKTELKHYNEFRNVITEALRWVQMTTDTGIKLKVET